jgi:Anti-sigma-K factor rskA/Sigma-70, region 4
MATFDQLSDEQRAIVELVLQQGKTYDELADLLGMPEARVRERARDALVDLAPISARGVEEDWRGQLADYVLGQQAGPEATATRGHLRRSEAARSWTRSLLDSLEQLYPNGDLPAIPDSGSRRATGEPSAPLGTAADPAVHRRRLLAAAAAVAALLLVVVLLWPIGVLTGDDGDDGATGAGSTGERSSSSISAQRQGAALIVRQDGTDRIVVSAQGLEPSTNTTAYQVWLYDSDSKRKSLGATPTDDKGNMQVMGELPADYKDWKFIDVSTVTVSGQGDNQQVRNGQSVLRGVLELADKPVETGTGNNRATLLAQITLRPLPN